MADTFKQRLHNTPVSGQLDFPDNIYKEIQNTLDTLAQLDQAYGQYRMMLERWSGSTAEKERAQAQLEKSHREDRQPLVMLLAHLHERMMSTSSQTTRH
jgi:hypothetical protein